MKTQTKLNQLLLVCSAFLLCQLVSCNSLSKRNGQSADLSLIPVYNGDQYQYIDYTGKIVINPQFKDASAFRCDLALVKDENGKWGYIDKTGKYIIQPIYKEATSFSDDVAVVVKENAAPSVIDKFGNELFVMQNADLMLGFDNGLAFFKEENADLYGLVDKSGKVVCPAQFSNAFGFSEGLMMVVNKEEKVGFINSSGEYVINPQFVKTGSFSDGYCIVKDKNDRYGYIDKKGNVVVNFQFSNAYDFHDGLAVVKSGGKYGAINKKGQFVINPQFDRMFADGDYFMIYKDDQWGWCSKKGEIVINPQFEDVAFGFGNGDCAAVINSDEEIGLIDKSGKYVINPQFEGLAPFVSNGWALFETGDGIGIIDKTGKYIVNPQYRAVSNDYIAAIADGILNDDEYMPNNYGDIKTIVHSDFVDPEPIQQYVKEHFIDEWPVSITYRDVKNKTGFSDFEFNDEIIYIYEDKEIVKGVDADLAVIGNVHYTKEETHREYYYGGYYYRDYINSVDCYHWDYTPNIFALSLNLYGKANGKADMIKYQINSALKSNGFQDIDENADVKGKISDSWYVSSFIEEYNSSMFIKGDEVISVGVPDSSSTNIIILRFSLDKIGDIDNSLFD